MYWRRALVAPFIFVCLLVAVLTPWTIRNYRVYHQVIPTTMIGEYNLWLGNTVSSTGGQWSSDFNPLNAYAHVNGYLHLKDAARTEFLSFVTHHPLQFVALSATRFVRYFSLIRPMGFWFYQHGIGQITFVACSGISIVVLFIFGITGIVLEYKKRCELPLYLIAFACIAPILLMATVVESRYRFQIYPFLALFAGVSMVSLFFHEKEVKKYLIGVGIFLFCISLIDAARSTGLIVDHIRTLFS